MAAKAATKKKARDMQGIAYGPEDILQLYAEIAFGKITDYVDFGPCAEDESKARIKLKDSAKIKNAQAIEEIIIGTAGTARVKLYDKFKALEKLERYYDLLPDLWKRKLEEKKLELAKKEKESPNLAVFTNVPRPGDNNEEC